MNLLIINYEYPPVGGGSSYAGREMAKAMVKLGHEITMVTSRTPLLKGYSEENGVRIIRLRSLRARIDRSNILEMAIFMISALFSIKKIATKYRIEGSICFFSFPGGPIGLFLQKQLGLPYVVSLRGGDVPGLEPKLENIHFLLKRFRQKIFANAEAIVANSDDLAERSRAVDSFPTFVIPNGIDADYFCPVNSRRQNEHDRPLSLLFVGRLQRQKEVPNLISKLALIRTRYKLRFVLTVVGDGPDLLETQRIASEHMMSDVIDWRGWLDRESLRNVYQQSDCLLNLSSYEGLPNVVLEAMACGLVIVASKIGPHEELVEEGVNGFLISKSDTQGLSRILAELVSDRGRCHKMGMSSRRKALDCFTWEAVADGYVKCFIKKPLQL